ncbi:MAG: cytochrome P450 [Bdellovibrionia bacterium]
MASEQTTVAADWGSTMSRNLLRYSSDGIDLRSAFMRFCGFLQGKPVVIIDSDPQLAAKVLQSSRVKGSFIERLFAIPAWNPIYSVESEDGERWETLAKECRHVLNSLKWRERIEPLVAKYVLQLEEKKRNHPSFQIDSPVVSRLTLRVLFELLFDQGIEPQDEDLFYQASLEWRKEIAIKGKGQPQVKEAFWLRLREIVSGSRFHEGLARYADDPGIWLSVFAQPFLISPQINVSDFFVSLVQSLGCDKNLLNRAQTIARSENRSELTGFILEALRLKHPFPILERELTEPLSYQGVQYARGTQFFILLDRFRQEESFNPDRWRSHFSQNPYQAIPFGTGPRMCLGKGLALDLLVSLTGSLLDRFAWEDLQPEVGHLYSGRNNDGKEGIFSVLYQLKKFIRALWLSFNWGCPMKGLKKKSCPFLLKPADFSEGSQQSPKHRPVG